MRNSESTISGLEALLESCAGSLGYCQGAGPIGRSKSGRHERRRWMARSVMVAAIVRNHPSRGSFAASSGGTVGGLAAHSDAL